MELHVIDRIYIPTILPAENTFMDYNMKRGIIAKVALTDADAEKFNIKEEPENKRTTWDINKDMESPLNVDFTEQELQYLKSACEKLADKPAPDNLWNTVEKIYEACQSKS